MTNTSGAKRILIITYAFWPMNIIGAARPTRLASALAAKGYIPIVLSTIPWDKETADFSGSEKMRGVKIRRTIFFLPPYIVRRARRIILPALDALARKAKNSEASLWMVKAVTYVFEALTLYADRLLDESLWNLGIVCSGLYIALTKKIDCIFCTAPPGSSLGFAAFLARIMRIPLVTDFRDLWTLSEYRDCDRDGNLRWRLNRAVEKYALNASSYVIYNTDTAKEIMDARYPFSAAKTVAIPNGIQLEPSRECLNIKKNGAFTICHIGSLYADRDPADFLATLKLWTNSPDFPKNLTVRFIGRGKEKVQEEVDRFGLSEFAEVHGHKSKQELLPMLGDVDVFLLFLGYREASAYVVPAKFYDYLSLERPIVAFAPKNGAVSRLMTHLGLADNVVSERDPEKVLEVLRREFKRRTDATERFRVPRDIKARYDYSSITDEIERVIRMAIEKRR